VQWGNLTTAASQATDAELSKAQTELDLLLQTIEAQLQNNLLTQTVGQLQVRAFDLEQKE
jgi:hypothetical protein